ncbi:tyrosine-protein phosphatase [Levilactobacillus lanxiensis]|uniref:Tyrosine-protein phosphatase n=1 Tax=Levilactobacillus lanxiensis TaxID=2799568 RepID=A0ABW4D069_9LACO|nr:tyrosine-protein phosphatase [Levilactobacillus lanxiensis]
MQRLSIIKSLSIAGVILSLLGAGTPSAYAATNSVQATAKAATKPDYTNQIRLYGDVNDKLVKLTGTQNTRDLGGYQTADHKWQIRPNRLLRSDNLNGITDADKTILTNDHHVTSIVDFRTDGQINKLPDQYIAGTTNISLSILGEKAYTDDSALNADFAKSDGGFYVEQLEFTKSAIDGYSRFLNLLLLNNQATLYHCSSGKDRTGIATVLIMTILGMDKQTIMNDFMQSAQTNRTVKESWLNEYYWEITSRYKTLDQYITNVLGFSRPQQEKLRSMLLVSTDGKNTPYPAPQAPAPTPAPQPSHPQPASTPTKPATTKDTDTPATGKQALDVAVPAEFGMADQIVTKKPKGKIISTKKLHTKYIYHLKAHKKWFKDAHLQNSLGHTAKHKRTTWKLVKSERIKINGKTRTYYQVKDHAGHKGWILKSYVVKVVGHKS